MNEIILAPCDVISKIKQNSSDMNEIILAPCDAGYVQSCTGSILTIILEGSLLLNPDEMREKTTIRGFSVAHAEIDISFRGQTSRGIF
jgi:hypothetical protein